MKVLQIVGNEGIKYSAIQRLSIQRRRRRAIRWLQNLELAQRLFERSTKGGVTMALSRANGKCSVPICGQKGCAKSSGCGSGVWSHTICLTMVRKFSGRREQVLEVLASRSTRQNQTNELGGYYYNDTVGSGWEEERENPKPSRTWRWMN